MNPAVAAGPLSAPTIGVLMAVHDRRAATLRCLWSLVDQDLSSRTSVAVVLVDDGSSDGTSDAVREAFPHVRAVLGSGELFWGGGMALAHEVMLNAGHPDYLLWLNDDVVLRPHALETLLEAATTYPDAIIAGALLDPEANVYTYSGLRRSGRSPLRLDRLEPHDALPEADTFNGNVVLIPQTAYLELGAIDSAFPHLYGDLDYGYRARKLGVPIRVAASVVGTCPRNSDAGTWTDSQLSPIRQLRSLHSTKVMPLGPRLAFLRRHGGPEWGARFFGGYLKAYVRIALRRQRRPET